MKQINIEIENTKLAELGIDQETEYRPLRFNERHLIGYWISKDAIIVYIGTEQFLCKICQKNIDLLDSILNDCSNNHNL